VARAEEEAVRHDPLHWNEDVEPIVDEPADAEVEADLRFLPPLAAEPHALSGHARGLPEAMVIEPA
jgi:hypothetical protein